MSSSESRKMNQICKEELFSRLLLRKTSRPATVYLKTVHGIPEKDAARLVKEVRSEIALLLK